jgi:hypothetical protein
MRGDLWSREDEPGAKSELVKVNAIYGSEKAFIYVYEKSNK